MTPEQTIQLTDAQADQMNTPEGLELTAEQLHQLNLGRRAAQVLVDGWEPLAEIDREQGTVWLWTDRLRPLTVTPDHRVCVRTAR